MRHRSPALSAASMLPSVALAGLQAIMAPRRLGGGAPRNSPMQKDLEPPEIIAVETQTVACDGVGPDGHPRVYLNLGDEGRVDCPYCGRRFTRRGGAAGAEHHQPNTE